MMSPTLFPKLAFEKIYNLKSLCASYNYDPDNEESTDDIEKGMDHGEKEGVAWSEDC